MVRIERVIMQGQCLASKLTPLLTSNVAALGSLYLPRLCAIFLSGLTEK